MRSLLARIFLDSPVSRAGAAIATLVGLTIGVPLSIGRVEVHDGLIVCQGLPQWAFRRGGTCVGRVYLTQRNVGPSVLKHERVHVQQWRRYGLLFPILYWAAGVDPLRNRFEIEAGLEDGGYVRRQPATPAQRPADRRRSAEASPS